MVQIGRNKTWNRAVKRLKIQHSIVSTKFLFPNAIIFDHICEMGRFRGFEVISPAHLPPKVHSSAVVSLFHYFLHTLVDLCGSSHLRVNSPHPQLRHFFFLFSLSLFLSLSLFFFYIPTILEQQQRASLLSPSDEAFSSLRVFQSFFFCRPAFMFSVCCHLIYSYVKKNNVGLPIYDIHKAIRLNYTI